MLKSKIRSALPKSIWNSCKAFKYRIECIVELLDAKATTGGIVFRSEEQIQNKTAKNLCVFASYSRTGRIQDYVLYYLTAIREQLKSDLIFVSTTKLPEEDFARLSRLCRVVVLRENIGLDFGSWKTGLNQIADINQYDNVFFANDSVYGPLFDLRTILAELEQSQPVLIGMTESFQVRYHVQSYFFAFNRSAIQSAFFTSFWNNLRYFKNKSLIIYYYEVGMTAAAGAAGLTVKALFPEISLQDSGEIKEATISKAGPTNPTHEHWKRLILSGFPFLKADLIRINQRHPMLKEVAVTISERSNYPLNLLPIVPVD